MRKFHGRTAERRARWNRMFGRQKIQIWMAKQGDRWLNREMGDYIGRWVAK
jgi:hypothetical protein